MTDYSELKRIAEAVKKSYSDLCEHGGDKLAEDKQGLLEDFAGLL